ncbi:bifunctional UDP-N-acetylglucosamine diphosphorylase/glucosamine-1-phosphate N-acetyltransferase GlmU [Pseudaminobacter sp. 19-2017]|uniref:Bifunctional protein GlmU n=1 Tax=Pseudaminobacter soli (ex Zhang et al. 2022) TaxID=2831468 RepID=A0A942E6B0_9HYPH|nr:bifunctional UDP-N-acetylglucosamine diphosphorylase/glucosamine-1-phosphate N-acetyltransferase GlmU [Pseudaminobacter soli]MBS3651315.1 bifunctional UDP-N-acetylglucosamine diphosphorylase/glucosamine-1-phosphate N-acetyltransferase GlmU [Pseudaminobacter soli]
MTSRTCLSIILAAGEGTRMKSSTPKVLHKIAGLPMLAHVFRAADEAGADSIAVVVGHEGDAVRAAAAKYSSHAEVFVQERRLGTAHAVLAAREAIARGYQDVLIMFGDTPLVDAGSLLVARGRLAEGNAVSVVGFRTDAPTGYGRLIEENGQLQAIREEKDCSPAERLITFCNSGLMAISGEHVLALLDQVGSDNAKGEFYLTDIVEIARKAGLKVAATEAPFESTLGVNTLVELAEAEAIWQRRRRREVMLAGVTLLAPETVFFSHDTEVGADALIEPNVFFGPGVSVGQGAIIHAFSHVEGAEVGPRAEIGPFARLRPGADIGEKAKVGNFCEIKKAAVEPGAKVNHLTYIGDARIGAGSNIGAGTITCNYDGFGKHYTDIGRDVFVGSNTALVAPVSIGDRANIAAGSVITDNVPADGLAFGRARQKTLPEYAPRLRARLSSAKKQRDAAE